MIYSYVGSIPAQECYPHRNIRTIVSVLEGVDMITFTKTPDPRHEGDRVTVSVSIDNEATGEDLVALLNEFMLGCGYSLDDNLRAVWGKDEEHSA
jgi:hypothetical protein